MFIVLIGRTLSTDVTSDLTVPLPVQTEMQFGYRVIGYDGNIAVFGYPVTGKCVVKQPPVITVAGNDINLAFGEFISPKVSFILMGLWWNW